MSPHVHGLPGRIIFICVLGILILGLSSPTLSAQTVNCSGVAAWSGNSVAYATGALVTYQGSEYKCIQAHTSQAGWDPVDAPALWANQGTCASGAAPTPTPTATATATVTPTAKPTPTPCTPTAITPYLLVGSGAWQQTASATVAAGSSVSLGPQPITGGTWSWTGPNGYTSTARQITVTVNSTSTYTATYTNPSGCISTQAFTITVTGSPTPTPTVTPTATPACTPTAITPYLMVGSGAWQQTASAAVTAGSSVTLGPQPVTGGTWSWTGPSGYTSTARQIAVTVNSTSTYTATYTNPCGSTSTQVFTLTVGTTSSAVNVLMQHNDLNRTGVNPNETILTPANVNVSQFGMLFKVAVDDQVFAQPLYVAGVNISGGTHNVFYVATANNSVYAFDADTGTQYWHVTLGTAFQYTDGSFNCSDILASMGIIATPVIDPNSQTLYVVVRTNENGSYFHRLHALDITTGADRSGSPVQVTTTGFNSAWQNQRPGLLLSQGNIYIAMGSNCDDPPYKGYVFAYNASTLAQTAVFNASPDDNGSAIWQSGNGLAADSSGNVYFVTGNGTWDGSRNFSESAIKVSSNLGFLDWYTPSDHSSLDASDSDLTTSGGMLIPGANLLVGAGKDGILHVLNTNNMGHLGDSSAVQNFQFASSHVHSMVYWNGQIYVWGQADNMKVYPFNGSTFSTTPSQTRSEVAIGHPGASLSISSNGNTNGILWAATNITGASGGLGAWHDTQPGILHAYNASSVSTELWNSYQAASRDDCNNYAKFTAPTIANGKVYLPSFGNPHTKSGQVCVYGLNPPAATLNTPLPNGTYTVTNVSSGLVWDDPASSTATGTLIEVWGANNGANQKWTFTSVGGGFYTITNQASGLVLDNPNSSTTPGQQLEQWTLNSGSNQYWLVTQRGTGYTIVSQASGLSVDAGANTQGTIIQQAVGVPGAATQIWSIK